MGEIKRNYLLISMSTLPRNIKKKNNYEMKETGFSCEAVSQLAPGTEYFIDKLHKNKSRLDRIFIICTPETKKEQDGEVAVDFYIKEIEEFIKKDPYSERYNTDIVFEKIDSEAITVTVKNVVNRIMEATKQDDIELNEIGLYRDIQGGHRNETFVVNSVLKLLETKELIVTEYVATNFDPAKAINGNPQEIVDVTEDERLYDLVSGMDEFIKYGRAERFKNYFDKGGQQEGWEKDFVNAVTQISDAISICDVNEFEKALSGMSEILNKNIDENEDPIFSLMISDLKEDYGSLITDNKTLIDEIKWCLKKDFIQQAITLVEAKAPEYIVNHSLVYYAKDENEKKEYIKTIAEEYIKNPEYKKYLFEDTAHYYIKNFLKRPNELYGSKNNDWTREKKFLHHCQGSIDDIKKLRSQYWELSNYRNDSNHANGQVDKRKLINHINEFVDIIIRLNNGLNINNHTITLEDIKQEAEAQNTIEENNRKRICIIKEYLLEDKSIQEINMFEQKEIDALSKIRGYEKWEPKRKKYLSGIDDPFIKMIKYKLKEVNGLQETDITDEVIMKELRPKEGKKGYERVVNWYTNSKKDKLLEIIMEG